MTPKTLVSNASRALTRSASPGALTRPPVTPALLTSTSSRSRPSAARRIEAGSVTSSWTNPAPTSAAAFSPRSGSRAPRCTVIPRSMSCFTISRPMPLLAPVTSAVVMSPTVAARGRAVQDRLGDHLYPGSMDSRELRYFVAVAEELNFGRAATRLGMAQPPLSRTIQQLERRMGVTLLERTSRSVALTAAGEVLLREGRRALSALTAAERRARRADSPRLVLAMKPISDGGLLEEILANYAADPASIEVEV